MTSYLISDPSTLVSMVGVYEFTCAVAFTEHPCAHVFGAGLLVRVDPLAVPRVALPFTFVHVAVWIGVDSEAVSLVVYPVTCVRVMGGRVNGEKV